MEENNENKKQKGSKKRSFGFAAALLLLVLIWWFNNYTLKTTETTYSSAKVKERFRIAVISDLHAHKYSISSKNILGKITSADPDAVFVLGDMYTSGSPLEDKVRAVNAAADIVNEGYPAYFVSGEHDYDDDYLEMLAESGVEVMNYRTEYLDIKGNKIKLMGIDNVYFSPTFDLHNEFQTDKDCFNILLAHIPYFKKYAEFGADLTLCADTHGGMVQLPWELGPAFDADSGEWFPEIGGQRDDIYDKGWFKYRGGAMFITSGIGDSPYPVRFNNRPEVVIMDILPEDGGAENEN